jgi:signal peptide peptidase SppA
MESKYPNFRQYFSSQFWAIRPETLDIMCSLLAHRISGETLSQEEIQARIGMIQRNGQQAQAGGIRVIPMYGVIDQKVNFMQQISGGTSVNDFMSSFREAMNDKSVSAIIFDVDSPGGSILGIQEAANEILASRGKKPIIAVADPMIASAAYWLSCAADEIVCMPSGWVGSVGVIKVHDDLSKMNEMEGSNPTYITYGKFKSEGNHDAPLSDDALAYYQSQVETIGESFTNFIAKARGLSSDKVRSDFGQGRMLLAKAAKSAKMIDSIGTMEQTIIRLQKPATIMSTLNGSIVTAAQDDDEEIVTATLKDFTTMKVKEATAEILVGVPATLESWDGLVARQIAGGKQLSASKKESILALQSGLGEWKTKVDGIIAKFAEPVVVALLEPKTTEEKPITDGQKAIAEYEMIRARGLGVKF